MKILDASEPEFGSPMTEDEVRNFLVNSKKNVHISTLDEKGEPNIIPHGIILTAIITKFT
jgi:hypothetical protein